MKFKKQIFLFLISILSLNVKAQQWGDYTLYSVMGNTNAYLLDTNGNTYHTWSGLLHGSGYSSYLLPGGTLVRAAVNPGNSFNGGAICGEVQKYSYAGALQWDYVYSTSAHCSHHDICPMPNGNVLLIAYESKTTAQVTAAGSSVSHIMWPDEIVEVQPSGATGGTIVWEWHAWDHLCQSYDSTKANYVSSIVAHPELLNINYNNQMNVSDWMHVNGLDYNETLDQITFSSHNLNEVYVIDHSTTTLEAASHAGGNSGHGGDLLYRWGNPAAYGATGTNIFHTVHDAHFIPAGCPHAGYLAGYNNNGISNSQSCVDYFYPPYSGYNYTHVAGQQYTPTTYDWRHACNGHNNNMGNSQELPNGNVLVCVAQSGLIYEIDSNQNIIWTKTITGTVPQAFRYSACYVSGTQPATPTISQNGNVLTSTTGTTYQWYFNGVIISGATNQNYTPTQNGNYQVMVIDASGCASALSSAFAFSGSGVNDLNEISSILIFPNPSSGLVFISQNSFSKNNIDVFDMYGKLILQATNTNMIDLSSAANGVYFVAITNEKGITTNKKISLIK